MLSAVLLINQKGEVIISRFYRGDVSRSAADAFRSKIIVAKESGTMPPVQFIDKTTFLYTRHKDLFFVALTKKNVNPAMVFHFLFTLISIFKSYFSDEFNEDSIRDNFTLVYELLDEVLDFGYPQNCAADVLKMYINLGEMTSKSDIKDSAITSQITGAIDWRKEGIKHRANEVFIDILESVNLLMSSTGNILRSDVTGYVMMKTYLTGMPECKFGLNDKILLDAEEKSGKKHSKPGVNIDDCTFHRCVRLGKFDADRTITFIPPDGEFELMRYRITDQVNLPFKVMPVIEDERKNKIAMTIKIVSQFSSKLAATNCVFKIPCPPNTARAGIQVSTGTAKYDASQHSIVWKIRKFPGDQEYSMNALVETMSSTMNDKAWSRPPIALEFQVPMFTASGLQVRFLKVFEKSSYKTTKWVRYITRAGEYQVRV